MTILTVPRLAEFYNRLKRLPTLQKCSIVFAGGCVRDILCQKPVKDLDLFIQVPADWTTETVEAIELMDECVGALNKYFYESGVSKSNLVVEGNTRSGGAKVYHVWAWSHTFADLPMDLIFVNDDPHTYVKTEFDFGICQAWYGYGGLHTTSAYRTDYLNKTITFIGDPTMKEFCANHAMRLAAKFPNWGFRNFARPKET